MNQEQDVGSDLTLELVASVEADVRHIVRGLVERKILEAIKPYMRGDVKKMATLRVVGKILDLTQHEFHYPG